LYRHILNRLTVYGDDKLTNFIGRDQEFTILKNLLSKKTASLVVIKGRRRIGKSRLLEEYAKLFKNIYIFSGIAPTDKTTKKSQHQEFTRQFVRQFKFTPEMQDDWGDLFWELSKQTQQGHVLIILDEITWMGSLDSDFLGKLKNAWDLYFKKNDQLILVLCGSVSSWIEKNILSSTGFLGRESLSLTLIELPLSDCVKFWGKEENHVSAYEKLKLLSVTGGVPRYLEAIDPKLSAETNIQQLCFRNYGILFNEFEKIFSDLFSKRSTLYKSMVSCLADGIASQADIIKKLKLTKSGDVSEYLDDLVKSGFISRDFTWHIKDNKPSMLSHYRLKDNYSRFYLKYILPNRNRIESGEIENMSLTDLPNWYTIMGLQIENLILSNRNLIKQALKIDPNNIVSNNPFFQRKTANQAGCQIDYMIQTKHNTLYICEIRFSKNEVGPKVIKAMQEKIERLKIPKGFSYRPVLIHVNGVSEFLEEQHYFTDIIDFSQFLVCSQQIK